MAALRRVHSYEEPAHDIYPLRSPPSAFGEGRLGMLPREQSLRDLGVDWHEPDYPAVPADARPWQVEVDLDQAKR